MQVSKKILVLTGAVLILFLVTSLIILRIDLQKVAEDYQPIKYDEIVTEPFHSLNFSSGWSVELIQGRGQEVKVGNLSDLDSDFNIENKDGMLEFRIDSAYQADKINVKVTTPNVKLIRAKGNTDIFMKSFQADSDSTQVFLEDSVLFKTFGNKLIRLSIKTVGKPRLELIRDPME